MSFKAKTYWVENENMYKVIISGMIPINLLLGGNVIIRKEKNIICKYSN